VESGGFHAKRGPWFGPCPKKWKNLIFSSRTYIRSLSSKTFGIGFEGEREAGGLSATALVCKGAGTSVTLYGDISSRGSHPGPLTMSAVATGLAA
jgi:hypothetical protein